MFSTVETPTKSKQLVCSICGQCFTRSGQLQQHFLSHHNDGNKTDALNETETKKDSRKRSKITNNPCTKQQYSCKKCSQKFDFLDQLRAHECHHSIEKPSLDKTSRQHSVSRVSTHGSEMIPFQCHFCGKCFSNKRTLKVHVNIHTDERPYRCHICPKAFNHPSSLRAHIDGHSGVRKYVCEHCGKGFTRHSVFRSHRQSHLEKAHECSECGRSFVFAWMKRRHMSMVHARHKPLECSYCGKSFSHAGNLKTHQVVHTGERPYNCEVCHKSFTQSSSLKTHIKSHGCDNYKLNRVSNESQDSNTSHVNINFYKMKHVTILNKDFDMEIQSELTLGKKDNYCNSEDSFTVPEEINDCKFDDDSEQATHKDDLVSPETENSIVENSLKKESFYCCDCGMNFTDSNDLIHHMTIHKYDKVKDQQVLNDENCSDINIQTITKNSSSIKSERLVCNVSSTGDVTNHEELKYESNDKNVANPISENNEEFVCETAEDSKINTNNINTDSDSGQYSPPLPRSNIKEFKSKTTKPNYKYSFTCRECGKKFVRPSKLEKHIKVCHVTVNNTPGRTDQDCGSYIPNSLKSNLKTYTFTCTEAECSKVFNCPYKLQRHLARHKKKPRQNNVNHLCPTCGKSISTASNLKKHQKRHLGIRNFKCSVCDKSFVEAITFRRHEATHTDSRPCICEVCGKAFSSLTTLQEHKPIHSEKRSHTCSDCGKEFRFRSSWRRHINSHRANKRQYSCQECGKDFNHICNLKKHSVVHSGEKRYSCVHCGKRFTQSSSLNTHMRSQHHRHNIVISPRNCDII